MPVARTVTGGPGRSIMISRRLDAGDCPRGGPGKSTPSICGTPQEADPGLTAAHPRAVAETLKRHSRTLGHAIVSCLLIGGVLTARSPSR